MAAILGERDRCDKRRAVDTAGPESRLQSRRPGEGTRGHHARGPSGAARLSGRGLTAIALAAAALAAGCGRIGADSPAAVAAELTRYCADCHNPIDLHGGFALERLDPAHVGANAAEWEAVVRKLRTRTMPPQDAPRPDGETYERLAAWLEAQLDANAAVNPGRPALRRLNRAEYAN